jgi:hypothetical protein
MATIVIQRWLSTKILRFGQYLVSM